MSDRRSPIKEPPLRMPGQSLQEQIDRVRDDIGEYAAMAAVGFCLALFEWSAVIFRLPRAPVFWTIGGALIVAFYLLRIRRANARLRQLELGRDGERAVADALDKLKQKGALVLHDVVGNGFNVDHVVLGSSGIYAIETKTYTKRQGAEITYDGKSVKVGGVDPERDPIREVSAIADWLRRTLKEMTGRHYHVRPVVVFPGWYVRNARSAEKPDVWVLNPEQVPAIIVNRPAVLAEADVRAAVYFLTRFVKTRTGAA